MNVVFLNTWDSVGGAARAAFRLLKGVQGTGVNARMLVQNKGGDDNTVIGLRTSVCHGGRLSREFFDALCLEFYPGREKIPFTAAYVPDNLSSKVMHLNPDIIHLHWIGDGFMRLESMKRFNRPLVWTLHDSWAFTGGCHVPFDCTRYRQACGKCPRLGSMRECDLSRWVWRRKMIAWQGLNLTVVTPSRWLADCAGTSSLFRDKRIEIIPNGLDLQRYKPVDRNLARELLSLPKNKKLILFGGLNSTSDRNKGFHLLLTALREMAELGWNNSTELIVLGSSIPAYALDFGLKATYMGKLHDDVSIALMYAAADVFVAPSIQENLPNTIMESMACGTPCVAFNQGGVPDLIEHEKNGYLARPFEPDDLAQGITWVLEDEDRRRALSFQARQKVEREFSIEKVAQRYTALYGEIMQQ